MSETMVFVLVAALSALIAYLLGSISTAVIVSKLGAKKDVRNFGSGNAGMTNVLRVFGKKMAVITLLGDFCKGIVAVFIGRWLFHLFGVTLMDGAYVAGLFALLGHIYPVYFGFKGGKGVLTACGIILTINPIVFGLLLIVTIPVILISKIVSLGSVLAAVVYPILTGIVLAVQDKPVLFDVLFACCMSVIVIVKHRSNIQRLLNGTENRFGKSKERREIEQEEKVKSQGQGHKDG